MFVLPELGDPQGGLHVPGAEGDKPAGAAGRTQEHSEKKKTRVKKILGANNKNFRSDYYHN